MIKALLSFFMHPITLTVMGLAALLGLVFFGGRALTSLTDLQLALIYGVVAALLLLLILWIRYRALKRHAQLERERREQGLEDATGVERNRRVEMRAMQSQFDEALDALKSTRLGKRAQEALPWYVVLGPPGSGKTTMLSKSGLNFPYTVQGKSWFRGVSGTRNCDWWFTDQGILLDTAGRYTTEAEDRREWISLLGMLRRARKHTPINGAVVTISMEDLLGESEEKIVEHAGRIRERLAELTTRLELVFPIYVVFTKCDLLPGFVETFGSLDRDERAQVWGCTLDRRRSADRSAERIFAEEFASLYDRLCSHRLSQMATERSVAETENVYSFPVEFAVAKSRLAEFVRLLVQPSPYHEGSDLRGFYFTSGTQDRPSVEKDDEAGSDMSGGVAGEGRKDVEAKSYFVDDLFNKVVFPDHGWARTSSRAALRKKLVSWSAIVGSIAATLALSILMIREYAENLSLINRSVTAVSEARLLRDSRETAPTNAERLSLQRLKSLFIELDNVRNSPGGYLLGRSKDLYPHVRNAYAEFVKKLLLMPLKEKLEQSLKASLAIGTAPEDTGTVEGMAPGSPTVVEASLQWDVMDAIKLDEQLTLYRMIGLETDNRGTDRVRRLPDADVIGDILEDLGNWDTDWREYSAPEWQDNAQLARLISKERPDQNRIWMIPLDSDIVVRAERRVDFETPLALLERASGAEIKTLEDLLPGVEIEGIRTDGIQLRLESPRELRHAEARLAAELSKLPGSENYIETLQANLRDLLRDDYVNKWKEVIGKLAPVEAVRLEEAMENLMRHTGAESVYKRAYLLVRANLAELSGSLPAEERELAEQLSELRESGADATWLTNALKDLRGIEAAVKEFTNQPNDDTRRVLRDMSAGGKRIWNVWDALNDGSRDALQKVDSNAETALRMQIRTALQNLVESVRGALMKEIVTEVTLYWEQEVGREFRALEAYYPFASMGPNVKDVPDDEFIRMFSPSLEELSLQGKYQTIYRELEAFTRPREETGEILLAFTESFREDYAQVEKLQRSMFSLSGQPLAVRFRVEMENDADISQTKLIFGSQEVRTDAMRPETLKQRIWTWSRSDKGAAIEVRVETEPHLDLRKPEVSEAPSTWSLFRLIESGRATDGEGDAIECEWVFKYEPKAGDEEERRAHLTLTAVYDPLKKADNPFRRGFFRGFEFAKEIFEPYVPRENRLEPRSEDEPEGR